MQEHRGSHGHGGLALKPSPCLSIVSASLSSYKRLGALRNRVLPHVPHATRAHIKTSFSSQDFALTSQALPKTTTYSLFLSLSPSRYVKSTVLCTLSRNLRSIFNQRGRAGCCYYDSCCSQSTNEHILQMTAGIVHLLDEEISACEKRRLGDKTVFTDGEFPAQVIFSSIAGLSVHSWPIISGMAFRYSNKLNLTAIHHIQSHQSFGARFLLPTTTA